MKKKIILFANTEWYLYNFRLALAELLRDEGWEVVLLSPPGEYGEKLRQVGFEWIPMDFSVRSVSPFHDIRLIYNLLKLYRQEQPDLVHHFTIKCVLYGTFAAKLAGEIKIVNAVTGLGHVFTDPGLKARLIRPVVRGLYRLALSGDKVRVIYQNTDDRDSFVEWGLVDGGRTQVIRGSGVNLDKFAGRGTRDAGRETVKILFASRLIKEKGVFELVEAFKIVKAKHPHLELLIAGDLYPENPSSLTAQDVEKLKETFGLSFLGHIDDMQSLLDDCDIVVLPSYREGTPRILIEAAAMEKPIVTTDIAGCRGLVVDGENGFLVPVNSVEPLVSAIEKLVDDANMRQRFGRRGREIVLEEFDENIVIHNTMSVYENVMNDGTRDAGRGTRKS